MFHKKVPAFEISTLDDIESIPDLTTAKLYMKQWKISKTGIKTKEEAIKKMTEWWRARELTEVFKEEDERKRNGIQKIKNDVEETKNVLHDVLVQVRDREGKLPLLQEKARDVHRLSKQFKKISYRARMKRWCRDRKCCLIIICIVILILIILAIITLIILHKQEVFK